LTATHNGPKNSNKVDAITRPQKALRPGNIANLKMSSVQIHIEGLSIDYRSQHSTGSFRAVDSVNLDVRRGEFLTIVGPSGCGKSTLLLALAGLVDYKGTMTIDGKHVSGPGPDRAVVFQEASLLPWRSVIGNVSFGMEMRRFARHDIPERVAKLVELVGLTQFSNYHPHQLSGGMRQRVNIARALAVDPAVLLMDEPFGALDALTREAMGSELLRVWETYRKTAIFVTHDVDEAIFLADRVVVMGRDPGHIKEVITIDLQRPRSSEIVESPQFATYKHRLRDHLAADRARQIQ